MKAIEIPDPDRLRALFSYDPETGIIRRLTTPTWFSKAGSVAGSASNSGYLTIGIEGKKYLAHRIAWAIHYGAQPPKIIDHVDGDKKNNSIGNLRGATQSQNCANRGKPRHSSTPFKGVIWNVKDRCWRARICVRGERRQLGSYSTAEQAASAYLDAAREAFGEFAKVPA